jgi:hypothetical protein
MPFAEVLRFARDPGRVAEAMGTAHR